MGNVRVGVPVGIVQARLPFTYLPACSRNGYSRSQRDRVGAGTDRSIGESECVGGTIHTNISGQAYAR